MSRLYRKEVKLFLETKAQNHSEAETYINEVAHSIHSLGHPLTTGGKNNRVVAVNHKSTRIKHIPKRLIKRVK